MRFVEQRITSGDGRGDCMSACLASILDLPYESVPDFSPAACTERRSNQFSEIMPWLRSMGYECLEGNLGWDMHGSQVAEIARPDLAGLTILYGWSPRIRGGGHAVVALDGGVVWDPHPRRDMGVGAIYGWLIVEKDGKRLRP